MILFIISVTALVMDGLGVQLVKNISRKLIQGVPMGHPVVVQLYQKIFYSKYQQNNVGPGPELDKV